MSEAPKRVWVGYSITGAPAWSVNPHEARGHDKATLFISEAALRELCEKWEHDDEVSAEAIIQLRKLLEGKED